MRGFKQLLKLPSPLLGLFLCQAFSNAEQADIVAPYEGEKIWKRDQHAQSRLVAESPIGVNKMSEDAGEKFWLHYWNFDEESAYNTTSPDFPLALHNDRSSRFPLLGRHIFRRDAACPVGTNSCASIGHTDSCCPSGSVCFSVPDTGNGPVGCCPSGQTCGSSIPDCNTAAGYSSCPNSTNKGCCIPGFSCAGNICVNAATITITPTPSTTSSTTTSSSTSPFSILTVVVVTTAGYTTTVTITQSTTTSSDSAVAPVRPTTETTTSATVIAPASVVTNSTTTSLVSSTTTTTAATATSSDGFCPTGFYMCSAVYLGGCCRVDRDCHTTTCPPTATTTVINGQVTVVAPTGASSNAPTCATGWYSCPASLGGNCCPNGYSCGVTDCPASITGAAAQSKQSPSEAVSLAFTWLYFVLAVLTALGMILL